MASLTKYAGTVTQTTGGKYCSFSNLNNIKNNATGSYAVSNILIQGKSETPNRPSTITCTNFGFNLPVGAEPTKVVITYRHQKVAGSDYSTRYPKRVVNIPAPTISLVGVDGFSSKAVAPSTDLESHTKTFKANLKDNKNLDHTVTSNVILTRSIVNSSNFGVKINYPTNTNAYNGYMRISFVRITVEYKVSSYNVSIKKVAGGYNNEDYTIQCSISNKNLTGYDPICTLTSPVGFTFKESGGTGTITQVNNRTFTWDPKLSAKVGTSSVNLVFVPDVTYPSGSSSYSGDFTLVEGLNSATNVHTAVITERPPTPSEESDDAPSYDSETDEDETAVALYTVPLFKVQNPTKWDFLVEGDEIPYISVSSIDRSLPPTGFFRVKITSDKTIKEYHRDNTGSGYARINTILPETPFTVFSFHLEDGQIYDWNEYYTEEILFSYDPVRANVSITSAYCPPDQDYEVESNWTTLFTTEFTIDFVPSIEDVESYTSPFFTILDLEDEEIARLGNGYSYVIESMIKHTTTDTFIRDWYKNNRIGVFNNAIAENITITTEEDPETGEIIETITDSTDYDNLTEQEIFENAEYWSQQTAGLNEYVNVECEFTYNENYPLHLIFTGDYPESTSYGFDQGEVSFTEPCIIEKNTYTGRKTRGNFPIPITYVIAEDGSTSELSIATLNQSDQVVLYDFPLGDGYGTNDDVSIRGIELIGNLEQCDEMILNAKIISDTGLVGERSLLISSLDTTLDSGVDFKVGGLGDLWGFNTQDIQNLEDWEVRLSFNNVLLEDLANINFGDLQLVLYVETLEKQLINIKVDNDDLSYYGAFIDNVVIPEGLETDTSFLTLDGTDTNDAYRQNIREKEIELSLTIGDCDLGSSTDLLRQLTKALVNEKDNINRPIPKRIEFSHYPDVYFEYIIKDALDIKPVQSYYEVKAKLVIPAGTSYSKQATTTNLTGNVQGIAAINPKITLKPQGSTIELLEINSRQRFGISYSGDWQSKILELDCSNRMALLKTNDDDTDPVDISGFVDFNSDWFSLKGEYAFSTTNCVVRTVEYTERW